MEDEESKKIAVHVNEVERERAMACCVALGFTLETTQGVQDIRPRAMGMKGIEVDFDAIEKGEQRSDVKPKSNSRRVDLGSVSQQTDAKYVPTEERLNQDEAEEFIKLDADEGRDFETLNYNHKVRRKLRRAIEHAEVEKELLVRQHALDYYEGKGLEAPAILRTKTRPVNVKGQRILENGTLETAKQERVRARVELAEFNTRMRILRRQAKEAAIYAGLRKYAEATGRLPPIEAVEGRGPDASDSADNVSEE